VKKWLLAIPILVLLLVRFWPHEALAQRVPLSTAVWSADGELLRVTLASDEQYRLWTPLSQMSPTLVKAFLLKEDRWFYWHAGVNPVALVRAGAKTYGGQGRQGASTLTMQLARLLYHLNTRTPAGKLRQVAAAHELQHQVRQSVYRAVVQCLHEARVRKGSGHQIFVFEPRRQFWIQGDPTMGDLECNGARVTGMERFEYRAHAAVSDLFQQRKLPEHAEVGACVACHRCHAPSSDGSVVCCIHPVQVLCRIPPVPGSCPCPPSTKGPPALGVFDQRHHFRFTLWISHCGDQNQADRVLDPADALGDQ